MTKKLEAPQKGLVGGQYKPLTDEEIEQIHEASLEVLERTGVQVEESEALRLFKEAGATVDENRVRFPRSMVEDAIDKAPSSVVLAGRDPEHDLILEDARVHIGTGGAALQVLDMDTGEIRKAVLDDVSDMARIVDALDNIHFFLIPIYPTDLPEDQVEISKYYASLTNTTKHVQAGIYTQRGILDVVAMCE